MKIAAISGMGWVSKASRGYPGHVLHSNDPSCLPRIPGKEILNRPYKAFGRMDNFSRIGFTAITFALADAGITPSEQKKNIATIASSFTGCLETDIHYQDSLSRGKGILPSPTIFAHTLPSCFLGEASIYHGLTGESFMIEEELTDGHRVLSMAMDLLEEDGCDTLVCGLCNSDIKLPDPIMEGKSPEPGALFLVLEKQRSKPRYGILTEDTSQDIFSHEGKKFISLTDLAKNILASK
ncbi:MAG: hypothetical protein GY710_24275 [Desulfobacteraceae bacterium]|nr:hypothetical protein [Desulfobacteraceae bacterium]